MWLSFDVQIVEAEVLMLISIQKKDWLRVHVSDFWTISLTSQLRSL